ncbi:MAG: hypothetical protein IIA92_02835 [Chloroflexi bacterium]|nr:hypothetical protein [Chloroflexota bacterium]
MTQLAQQHIGGLSTWRKFAFLFSAICALISLALVIVFVIWHLTDKASVEKQALKDAVQIAVNDAAAINEALHNIQVIAKEVAKDLSSGELTPAGLEERLVDELRRNPNASAVTVAYRPEFVPESVRSLGRHIYAPFSMKNEQGDIEIVILDDQFDYTAPDGSLSRDGQEMKTNWYHGPLEAKEVVWGEPYFSPGTQKYWAGVGTPFYLPAGGNGELTVAGVVDVSLELRQFQKLLATVTMEERLASGNEEEDRPAAGYQFLVSQSGVVIVSPIPFEEILTQQKTLKDFDADLSIAVLERMHEEERKTDKPAVVEHTDAVSGQDQWLSFAPVGRAGWWLGIVLDQKQFRSDKVEDRWRRQQIGVALAVMGFMFFGSVIVLRAYRGGNRGLWTASVVFSVLSISAISYLWFISITNESRDDDRNILLVERATTEKVISNFMLKNSDLITVPTGIYVQSVEFTSANNVTVTGYIWQRYPADLPENFAGIKPSEPAPGLSLTPGFIFPEADSITVSEVYRQVQDNGDEVIGWDFRTVLRQQFDYAKYPFDREDVWIRMWHKDFDKSVMLTPDLASYPSTDPESKPGLDIHDFVLEDWDTTRSFFSYRQNRYNTDFGIENVARTVEIPELYFNIGLKRRFINAFVSNLIPIIVVSFLLFAVLLTVKSRRDDGNLLGFSTSGVLSFSAALFFVVIVAHVNLRTSLAAQGIIYLELFYFLMYGAILSVAINSLTVASSAGGWFVRYGDNLIARLIYWPVITGLLLAFTLVAFW